MQGIESTVRRLRELAPQTPSARLAPARFFLAGCGVLTLAFEGFTSGLLELKSGVRHGLAPEYPGSLWPKVTLAALKDDQPLSEGEIRRIWEATQHADSVLAAEHRPIQISELHVVEALTRSLELTGHSARIALDERPEDTVPDDHRRFVQEVLGQWSRNPRPRYLKAVRRAGHRLEHYQKPCRCHTLVSFLGGRIHGVEALRERLERILPDRYHWFDPRALHVTIRTLEPASPASEVDSVELLSEDHL